MTELKQAHELSILQYVSSIGLNPEHVYYQRTTTNNKSTANLQWTLIAPAQRLLLLDQAEIDLKFDIKKQRTLADGTGGVDEDFQIGDKISPKEGFPLTNAMTSITTIINGATQTLNQPRHWIYKLAMMYAGRKGIKNCNPNGGRFWDLDGEYSPFVNNAGIGNIERGNLVAPDKSLRENEKDMMTELIKNNANVAPADEEMTYVLREKVVSPPFNPFGMVKEDMPEYCWFKHMSPVIGNISRLELDIQMSNFAPSLFFYRFAQNDDATGAQVATLSVDTISEAGITLYWYKMPDKMSIPRNIIYQTWSVRQFVKSISGANAPINNDELANGVSDLLQLHSIPSLIVVSVERDRDDTTAGRTYSLRALTARDTNTPENINLGAFGNNSFDDMAEIVSMQVEFGDKTGIITPARRQEELYYITKKNSIMKDFPYDYYKWRGRKTAVATASNDAESELVYNYPSKCFIAFRPKDLGIGISDGVQHNITFKVSELNVRGRSAFPAVGVWNHTYRIYIHVFYGKHTLELTPESGKFMEQRFSVDSIRSIGATGGSIKVVPDDNRYISRVQ